MLRDEKRAADDEVHQRDVEVMRLPRFMQEKRLSGAQIGSAFHRAMCMMDLDRLKHAPRLEDEIAAQMDGLLESGVLSEAERGAVPPHMLTRFFASPTGVRLLQSERVQREWAFTWKRVTPEGETQLLQGVIDCCFVEDGRWVLVDYKTDRDAAGAIARHRGQIELYAAALEEITGMQVSGRVLYLVRTGVGYSV